MWKRFQCFQPGEGHSRGLLPDCEIRCIVFSSKHFSPGSLQQTVGLTDLTSEAGIYLARCKTRSWIRSTSLARFCTITDPWYRLQDTALILHLPHLPSPSISARTRAVSAAEPSSRQFNDRGRGKYLNVCTTIFLQFRGKNCSENTQGCNVSWASQLRGTQHTAQYIYTVCFIGLQNFCNYKIVIHQINLISRPLNSSL